MRFLLLVAKGVALRVYAGGTGVYGLEALAGLAGSGRRGKVGAFEKFP